MRGLFPRTWLGVTRGVLIAAEVSLVALALGTTGALAGIRERWDDLNRTPESRGAQTYQMACAGCHGGATGGGITDQPPKHNANGHTWQHADCELLEVIRDGMTPAVASARPPTVRPDASGMPAYRRRLTDGEIRDVIAYIRTMWSDDQRAVQQDTTRERCAG